MSALEFEPYAQLRESRKIIIFGGGCYGALFSSRIERAKKQGFLNYAYQLIVDLDISCKAISGSEAPDIVFFNGDWLDFMLSYFKYFANENDYIVLPCNTPHFLFKLYKRMVETNGVGKIKMYELMEKIGYPYEIFKEDTIFVSYANWTCPHLCIEPKICPAKRIKRTWSVKEKLLTYLYQRMKLSPKDIYVFETDLYINGVALISANKILKEYNRFVSQLEEVPDRTYMIATISNCHGAISFFKV